MNRYLTAGLAMSLAAAAIVGPATTANATPKHAKAGEHVLLISVDGMHQADLDWYTSTHPGSALAELTNKGVDFTNAQTTYPSDSFPGMMAQATGGNPGTTGIYYDDTFNHNVFPAGTTDCSGPVPGAEVAMTEAADKDQTRLDAGQGLAGLPASILQMTGTPQSLLNPAALPVDPATCKPIYPHSYLKVNTIFEVAKQAGLRTAWSDKHPAYEILNGPSGTGLDDLFAPEINSDATGYKGDWTKDNAATRQYDSYKVQAVLNEIAGKDHSGTQNVGTPAIFGMNFQALSTAQKLPSSDGMTGGYLSGGKVPGPLVSSTLDYIDQQLGSMVTALKSNGLYGHTTIILSAKHGQSPTDPDALRRVDDGPIFDGLNAAWKAKSGAATDLVEFSSDDDGMLVWLSDRSPAAKQFASDYLRSHGAAANTIAGTATTVQASGLTKVMIDPAQIAAAFGTGDSRQPDLVGVGQYGVVYTGGKSKIAEHGGAAKDDRNVPIVISGPRVKHGANGQAVETTQIAPTILTLLGLDPQQLQAVRAEGTQTLPY